eukprot:1156050-Pelagomonas_calceolata.AAC.2
MDGKMVNIKRFPSFVQKGRYGGGSASSPGHLEVGEGISLSIERAWSPNWVKVNATRMTEIHNTEYLFVEQGFRTVFGSYRDGVMAVCKKLDRLVVDKQQEGLKGTKDAWNFSQRASGSFVKMGRRTSMS